jgi:hypothetical protein
VEAALSGLRTTIHLLLVSTFVPAKRIVLDMY